MKRKFTLFNYIQLTTAGVCLIIAIVFFATEYDDKHHLGLGIILLFAGIFNVYSCLLTMAYKLRFIKLYEEKTSALERFMFYKNRCVALQREVDDLSEMREIHLAATVHANFERLIHEVMIRINNMVNAKEISLFLIDSQKYSPAPKAYYCKDDKMEMFLYFKQDTDHIVPGDLLPKNIVALHQGPNVMLGANLKHSGNIVGSAKLTLIMGEGETLNRREQGRVFKEAVNSLNICNDNVFEAIEYNHVFRAMQDNVLDIATPLMAESEVVGVLKSKIEMIHDEDLDRIEDIERKLLETLKDISHAIKKEELFEKSIKDGLTGLFIKRHFDNQMTGYIRLAKTHDRPLSLMMIDIDHFKNVNDTYGHLTGDIVLREVGKLVTASIRESDSAYRYGGEEMAVVLPTLDVKGAHEVAERLRQKIEKTVFIAEDGKTKVPITISIGICEYSGKMSKPNELVAEADKALYYAKEHGRNQVVVASELPS